MQEMKRFVASRWVELLIMGVWLPSAISAAFSGNWLTIVLAVVGGLVAVLPIIALVDRLRPKPRPSFEESEAFAVPRQGLIFTLGMQKDTVLFALAAQKPAWLGLIGTRQTKTLAKEIQETAGLDDDHVQAEVVIHGVSSRSDKRPNSLLTGWEQWCHVRARRCGHHGGYLDHVSRRVFCQRPNTVSTASMCALTMMRPTSVFLTAKEECWSAAMRQRSLVELADCASRHY